MPSAVVFKLALVLADEGRFDEAERLFRGRFFPREEFGTNVRAAWLEVRLARALAAARAGRAKRGSRDRRHARPSGARSRVHERRPRGVPRRAAVPAPPRRPLRAVPRRSERSSELDEGRRRRRRLPVPRPGLRAPRGAAPRSGGRGAVAEFGSSAASRRSTRVSSSGRTTRASSRRRAASRSTRSAGNPKPARRSTARCCCPTSASPTASRRRRRSPCARRPRDEPHASTIGNGGGPDGRHGSRRGARPRRARPPPQPRTRPRRSGRCRARRRSGTIACCSPTP